MSTESPSPSPTAPKLVAPRSRLVRLAVGVAKVAADIAIDAAAIAVIRKASD